MYVGRPVALESRHVTLDFPVGETSVLSHKFWRPYVDKNDDLQSICLLDPINEMTRHNVLLCAKAQSIREVLYVHPSGLMTKLQLINSKLQQSEDPGRQSRPYS
jgi:hypothetical protein